MINLKDKNILYITHSYKDWIKDPIQIISKEFNHVYVLVLHKPIADILELFSFPIILKLEDLIFKQNHRIYTSKYRIQKDNLPSNVTVIETPIFYLPFKFWIDRIGDLHLNAVIKVIKKYGIKFDMVHSHITWSAGYVGMKLKELYNVPFILTTHGRDVYQRPFESTMRMNNTKKIFSLADRLITVSNFTKKIMSEILSDKSRGISVVPNGFVRKKFDKIDIDKAREIINIDNNKKVITIVGNVEKIKGHIYLIEAVRELVTDYPNILVIIIGNGPDKLMLESKVKEYGLENNFRFEGIVPNEKLYIYLSASDLFVLPSLGEGNPTVMFESLACGLPFVGTRVGGIPDIINDNCGIVVEPKDINGLKEAIIRGLSTKWNRESIRDYAMQFEWENVTKNIINIYKNLK